MATFYLGYDNDGTDFLTEYPSAKEAALNAEEWCAVEAETREEAENNYEEAFNRWRKKENVDAFLYILYRKMGIDKPANHDKILEFVFEDVHTSADDEEWHDGDVAIAFRRWMESKDE